MNLSSINPAFLVFMAAVLLAWATYNFQSRQSNNSASMKQQIDTAVNLMQQMATQTGNKDLLKEIVDTRTKLLSADRPKDDDAIREILARVPRLTEEYKKLETTKANAADQTLTEFRANWEPSIKVAVGEFDERVGAVIANGVNVKLTKEASFKVAGIEQDGGNSQLIRIAEMNGVQLRLYCSSAQIHPTRLEAGHLIITVRIPEKPENHSNPLSVRFELKEASAGEAKFAAAEQAANRALSAAIVAGINKGIEDFLVLASARKG